MNNINQRLLATAYNREKKLHKCIYADDGDENGGDAT